MVDDVHNEWLSSSFPPEQILVLFQEDMYRLVRCMMDNDDDVDRLVMIEIHSVHYARWSLSFLFLVLIMAV